MSRYALITMLILGNILHWMAQTKKSIDSNHSTSGNITDSAKRSAEIDALLAPWSKSDSPGAAVIVIKDGKVLHSKGYGIANRETKEPFRPDTPTLIGSVAKQFTSMAVMILADQGKLNYDDPLEKFFSEISPQSRKITVRNLLNHMSGLSNFEGFLDQKKKEADRLTPKDLLSQYLQQQLRFAPGEKWEYSNGGYVVLSHIVEKASGKDFKQFVREHIFQPLGMNNTFFAEEPRLETSKRAIGYYREWHGLKVSEYLAPLKFFNGAASMFSTVEDLYKWDQTLYTEKLVRAATLKQAFTRGKLNDGTEWHYGFGWEVYNYKGAKYVIHPGGWGGFKSFILRFPEQHFTVIALSNSGQFDIVNLPIAITKIYLSEQIAVPPKVGSHEPYDTPRNLDR